MAHPLDPLDTNELERAVAIARDVLGLGEGVRFIEVGLAEPEKAALLAWRDGAAAPLRQATLTLLDNATGKAEVAVVALDAGEVVSREPISGSQPAMSIDEFVEGGEAVKADPGYRAALARRGIGPDQVDLVHVEPWTAGDFEGAERRLARAISWLRSSADDPNPYARPIGGLLAIVDLNTMQVVRIDDHGPLPLPGQAWTYRDGGGRPYRDDLRPVEISQPDGPSFQIEGRELRWQRWRLHVGFSNREGLVLNEIAYEDDGRLRPVCHRASIAELVIPYGDPNPTMHFKNVFDVGEYGLGPLVNQLERGCDCLGEIRYLDAAHVDSRGAPVLLRNAICIHEEDSGLLWKHTDDQTGHVDLARARRLVISCIATVGNYEYGYYWYLHQDGEIRFEGKLTGIIHTAGVEPGSPQRHATEVAPGVAAGYHQHFFTARLDLDVDGIENVAYEVEAEPLPAGPENPEGSAFVARRRTFARESDAMRDASPLTARRWRVENPDRRNRMGTPVAYELVPGDTVSPMALPDSGFRRRAGHLDHHLWVTPYRPDERFPAGEHPNQASGGDGLPRWTAADRTLENEDLVLWYTFGSHHVPRLEDWPVMPVASCGFALRPVGFFDHNPALDVPPPATHCEPA
jgi:primary-amine oxidase